MGRARGDGWKSNRSTAILIAVALASSLAGCGSSAAQSSGDPLSASDDGLPDVASLAEPIEVEAFGDLPNSDEIRRKVDAAIEYGFRQRHLTTGDHAAWQIIHAAVAFGRDLLVRDGHGRLVPAVDYVLDGGYMKGWNLDPGAALENGRRGVVSQLEPGSTTGQGHKDQWLGYLGGAGIPALRTVAVRGATHTIADWVEQLKLDIHEGTERGWTLMAFAAYLPLDAQWQAGDGSRWSFERIMAVEAAQPMSGASCGGTHALGGLVLALNRHLYAGGKLRDSRGEYVADGWAAADRRIQQCIRIARAFQQADGSFSSEYFQRAAHSADLAVRMRTTGHTLEFLTMALGDAQLAQPWVTAAVVHLCDILESTKDLDLECGALYHGLHGLVLYRQRRFGKLDLSRWAREDLAADRAGAR